MSLGENVGCFTGRNVNSSGRGYISTSITPVINSISVTADNAVVTINFNTGITATDYALGFSLVINGNVDATLSVSDITNVSNGVLKLLSSVSYVANDTLVLTYLDSVGDVASVSGSVQLADQTINATVASAGFSGNLFNINWEQYPTGNLQEQNLEKNNTSWHDWAGVGPNVASQGDIVTTPVYSGSQAMKMTKPAARENWGANYKPGTAGVPINFPGEMWLSFWLYMPTSFNVEDSNIMKYIRIYVDNGGSLDWILWRLKSGGGYDTQTSRQGSGGTVSFSPSGSLWSDGLGEWVQWEMYLNVDTNSSNNIERYYRNQTLLKETLGRPFIGASGNIFRIQFWPEWHAPGNVPLNNDYFLFCDNMKCTNGSKKPSQIGSDGNLIIGTS